MRFIFLLISVHFNCSLKDFDTYNCAYCFQWFFYTRKTFLPFNFFYFQKKKAKNWFSLSSLIFLWSQQQRIQKKIRVLRNEHKKLHSCFSLACWFYRFIFGLRRSERESKWEKNCTLLKDQSKFSGCSLNAMKITPEKNCMQKNNKRWNGISKI